MDQSVIIIPFNYKIEPGDSEFSMEIQRRFRDDPNRLFQFSSITLSPDYFSQKAYSLGMDSDRELQATIVNNFHLEIELDRDVYDAKPWTFGTKTTNLGEILKSINSHYNLYKPAGCILQVVTFDWIDILSMGRNVNSEEFHKSNAKKYYGEEYDATKHFNWLPKDVADKTNLNNMLFPTQSDIVKDIRIRMTITSNTLITFSNKELLDILGASETQIPDKVKNQYQFKNNHAKMYQILFYATPKFDKFTVSTKLHAYPASNFIATDVGTLKTTVENERKPDTMAKDYNNKISSLSYAQNFDLKLIHVPEEKKFKFIYPSTTGIRINIRVPTYIAHKLGFGHVDNIKYNMTSMAYPVDDVTGDALTKSQILVNDTGMVVVSLDERGSQQTHQFASTYMAHLEAHSSGVLKTLPGIEMPRVPISQFKKELTFSLSRMNDNNEPIPLGWKTGATIRGVLLGKV